MKVILKIIISYFLLSLLSCIHTQTYRPEAIVLISLKNMNVACEATHPKIYIGAGSHQLISDCTYRLAFDRARGGANYFLRQKIRESDPWKGKRMVLTVDSKEYEFSVEEIKNMPTISMGDSVAYQLNIH